MADPEDILAFWFGDALTDAAVLKARGAFWYGANPQVDEEIRNRFGDLHRAAAAGDLHDWAEEAQGRLALILILDQFSRNLYRGRAEAFAADATAQALCLQGIALDHDRQLHPVHRSFFYMPLEHAEDSGLQKESVRLLGGLSAQVEGGDAALQDYLRNAADWAQEHAGIVERFGRFPHRNRVLGRTSTPQELEYLNEGGASYGQ